MVVPGAVVVLIIVSREVDTTVIDSTAVLVAVTVMTSLEPLTMVVTVPFLDMVVNPEEIGVELPGYDDPGGSTTMVAGRLVGTTVMADVTPEGAAVTVMPPVDVPYA